MIGSKWIWLRDKSLELGKIDAAALAQEIEDALYECYGSTTIDAWQKASENEILNIYQEDIDNLIDDNLFCRDAKKVEDHGIVKYANLAKRLVNVAILILYLCAFVKLLNGKNLIASTACMVQNRERIYKMHPNPLKKLGTLLRETIDDFCNAEEEKKGSDYLVLLSRFLISYSDECIRLSRDYSHNNVLLETEKNDPYFKIPKYQWHDQNVSELKIPIQNNEIPICVAVHRDIPSPTSNSFRVAVYKPTKIKEFDQYQYEFVRMDER